MADEAERTADWVRSEVGEWRRHLEILYEQVKAALRPYAEQVSVNPRLLTLVEEHLGEYTVETLLIRFAHTEILLEPVGTMLIGAKGRVDVIGPFGKTPLLLLNSKARRLSDMIQVSVSIGNKASRLSSKHALREPISWEWRLVSKSPGRELISLSDEVILGLFAEVANG